MAGSNKSNGWCVYALRCRNNYIYIGVTNNLKKRLETHENGTGSKFVRSRRPFELVKVIWCAGGTEARQREYRLKSMKRAKKIKELGIKIDGLHHSCTFASASEKDLPMPASPFNSMFDRSRARLK